MMRKEYKLRLTKFALETIIQFTILNGKQFTVKRSFNVESRVNDDVYLNT